MYIPRLYKLSALVKPLSSNLLKHDEEFIANKNKSDILKNPTDTAEKPVDSKKDKLIGVLRMRSLLTGHLLNMDANRLLKKLDAVEPMVRKAVGYLYGPSAGDQIMEEAVKNLRKHSPVLSISGEVSPDGLLDPLHALKFANKANTTVPVGYIRHWKQALPAILTLLLTELNKIMPKGVKLSKLPNIVDVSDPKKSNKYLRRLVLARRILLDYKYKHELQSLDLSSRYRWLGSDYSDRDALIKAFLDNWKKSVYTSKTYPTLNPSSQKLSPLDQALLDAIFK